MGNGQVDMGKYERYTGPSSIARTSEFFTHEDLPVEGSGDLVVTIEEVGIRRNVKFETGPRREVVLVLLFQGFKRALVLNATNRKRLNSLFGLVTADWVGKRITLYRQDGVVVQGEEKSAVRIRKDLPRDDSAPRSTSQRPAPSPREETPFDDPPAKPARRAPAPAAPAAALVTDATLGEIKEARIALENALMERHLLDGIAATTPLEALVKWLAAKGFDFLPTIQAVRAKTLTEAMARQAVESLRGQLAALTAPAAAPTSPVDEALSAPPAPRATPMTEAEVDEHSRHLFGD